MRCYEVSSPLAFERAPGKAILPQGSIYLVAEFDNITRSPSVHVSNVLEKIFKWFKKCYNVQIIFYFIRTKPQFNSVQLQV